MIDSRLPGPVQMVLWALTVDERTINQHHAPDQLLADLEQAFEDFDLLVAEKVAAVRRRLEDDNGDAA
jgi:hypothetical protein